jgi:hypothetical protein
LKRWLITHTTKIGTLTTVHGHYSCGGVILATVMELQTGRYLMTHSGHFRGSPSWTSMDKLYIAASHWWIFRQILQTKSLCPLDGINAPWRGSSLPNEPTCLIIFVTIWVCFFG